MAKTMTLRQAYGQGSGWLQERNVPDAGLDAWYLLEHVTGWTKSDYYAHGEWCLSPEQELRYRDLLELRGQRIPLQHLIGEQEFMGLIFRVSPAVLIPRQDTEVLVEEAVKVIKPGMQVLDVCTGSGCILISILRYCPETTGLGVDISEEALAVAAVNGECLLEPGRAVFRHSDMFSKVAEQEQFDCIVSNPPYIESRVIEGLMEEVRDHEPRIALDGGEDGLLFYRILAEKAGCHLKEQGWIFVEIGWDQGEAVSELFREAGLSQIRVIRDLAGKDRVVCGKKEGEKKQYV